MIILIILGAVGFGFISGAVIMALLNAASYENELRENHQRSKQRIKDK